MKYLFVLTLIIFSVNACVERENYEDITPPPITGLFTEISGNLSGTLSRANSPYLVKDDITIESNDTLRIEPGVEIYFDDGKKLIVNGTLIAIGTRYRRIIFTAYNNYWEGIKFLNAFNNSQINFSIIEKILYEKQDGAVQSGISLINSTADFKNNYIINNKSRLGGAIGLRNSQLIVYNTIFRNNSSQYQGGTIYSVNSSVKMINCVLYKNSSQSDGAGIYIQSHLYTEIQNNIFHKNSALTGKHNFVFVPSDSTNLIEQYNFYGDEDNDPMFLFEDDFRLYYQSPCKDAGNPDSIFNDIDGSRNDQGAYGGPFGGW